MVASVPWNCHLSLETNIIYFCWNYHNLATSDTKLGSYVGSLIPESKELVSSGKRATPGCGVFSTSGCDHFLEWNGLHRNISFFGGQFALLVSVRRDCCHNDSPASQRSFQPGKRAQSYPEPPLRTTYCP